MAPQILPRQQSFATTNNIAGGLIAAFLCFVILLCLLCLFRFHRSKTIEKRMAKRGAPPFCVKGVRPTMTENNPLSSSIPFFSRDGLTASIVMPEKSITRKPSSHGLSDKTVVSSHLEPPPTPSRHRALSNSGAPRPRALSILNPASPRHSRGSSGFNRYSQYSFPSGSYSRRSSTTLSASPSQAKPVRQLFEPVLPDELSLARSGEHLTVLRSFNDGWCLVVRDTSRRTSRLSVLMKSNGDNVELGLVPAWVFAKPVKDVTAARPIRSTSVNAFHLDENPIPTYARDAVISWSNFA